MQGMAQVQGAVQGAQMMMMPVMQQMPAGIPARYVPGDEVILQEYVPLPIQRENVLYSSRLL